MSSGFVPEKLKRHIRRPMQHTYNVFGMPVSLLYSVQTNLEVEICGEAINIPEIIISVLAI